MVHTRDMAINIQKTIKKNEKPNAKRSPPRTRPTTLARLCTTLMGPEDALESISDNH